MTEDCYYVTYDRYGKRFEVKNHDEFIEGFRDVEDAIRLCKMLRRMAEFNGGGDDNLTLEDLEKAAEYLKREIEKERASAPINREEIGWHPEDWSQHIVPQSSVEDIYSWLKREGALGNIIFNDAKWAKP